MSGTFEARYRSGCLACETTIRPGDEVKWADDSVIHAECKVLDESFNEVPSTCPRCFTVPAKNGDCGCDT